MTVSNAGGNDSRIETNYITVLNLPVAEFSATPTSGTTPLTVQFTDNSTSTPTAWSWDFDNDGIEDSTEQNPSHIYTTPGTYSVKLTVSNAGGNDSIIKTDYITVSAPPTKKKDKHFPNCQMATTGEASLNDIIGGILPLCILFMMFLFVKRRQAKISTN